MYEISAEGWVKVNGILNEVKRKREKKKIENQHPLTKRVIEKIRAYEKFSEVKSTLKAFFDTFSTAKSKPVLRKELLRIGNLFKSAVNSLHLSINRHTDEKISYSECYYLMENYLKIKENFVLNEQFICRVIRLFCREERKHKKKKKEKTVNEVAQEESLPGELTSVESSTTTETNGKEVLLPREKWDLVKQIIMNRGIVRSAWGNFDADSWPALSEIEINCIEEGRIKYFIINIRKYFILLNSHERSGFKETLMDIAREISIFLSDIARKLNKPEKKYDYGNFSAILEKYLIDKANLDIPKGFIYQADHYWRVLSYKYRPMTIAKKKTSVKKKENNRVSTRGTNEKRKAKKKASNQRAGKKQRKETVPSPQDTSSQAVNFEENTAAFFSAATSVRDLEATLDQSLAAPPASPVVTQTVLELEVPLSASNAPQTGVLSEENAFFPKFTSARDLEAMLKESPLSPQEIETELEEGEKNACFPKFTKARDLEAAMLQEPLLSPQEIETESETELEESEAELELVSELEPLPEPAPAPLLPSIGSVLGDVLAKRIPLHGEQRATFFFQNPASSAPNLEPGRKNDYRK